MATAQPDITKLSDAELNALPTKPAAPASDITKLSDADLARLYAQTQKPGALEDAARTIPGGIAKGVTGIIGLPGTLSDAASSGLDWLANKVTGADIHPREVHTKLFGHDISVSGNPLSGTNLANAVAAPFGGFYEPKTDLGRYTETASEFLPAAFGGDATLAERAIGRVLSPAITSETVGNIPGIKGSAIEPYARTLAAMLGGGVGAAKAGGRAYANAKFPTTAAALPADEANLVLQYEQMGGHLRPGQYNPSNLIRQGDAVAADTAWPRAAGFSANDPTFVLPSQQVDEFHQLLSNTIGEDAPRITDQTIANAKQ